MYIPHGYLPLICHLSSHHGTLPISYYILLQVEATYTWSYRIYELILLSMRLVRPSLHHLRPLPASYAKVTYHVGLFIT